MNEETKPFLQIGADGIDVHALESEILDTVARKRAQGIYDDSLVARAERNNLLTMEDDETFLKQYLACLRQIINVDINDFEIRERHGRLAPLMKALKKIIWKLLKFYTYRLWSQQNQTNNILLAAVEIMNRRQEREINDLKARIAKLEAR